MKARSAFAVLALTLASLGASGCASMVSWDARPTDGGWSEPVRDGYHVVEEGDTLYSIAFAAGQDYRELARWNGIGWPYRIYPDQRLRVTPPSGRAAAAGTASAVEPAARRGAARPRIEEARSERRAEVAPRWQWPTEGQVIKNFSHGESGRKGLDIGGVAGQPVRAAANGRVVYSGSGLRGYGKLIIIKHDDVYLSAYGHNRRLLVKEGEVLRGGQLIAELGDTGATQPMLHFEIRRNGEPVDPQSLLPKR